MGYGGDEEVHFTGTILRQTDMAVLFKGRTWQEDEAVWLPISQISIIQRTETEGFKAGEVTVSIPEWLAEKKDML